MKYKILAGIAVMALLTLGGGTAAHANGATGPSITYKLIDKSKTSSYVNKSKLIGRCTVGTAGSTCSIAKGKTVTNTFSVALNIPIDELTAQLGMSTAKATTVTVTCNSPRLKKGKSWSAYAVGTRYKYKVREYAQVASVKKIAGTSGYKYSFHATGNKEYCVVD